MAKLKVQSAHNAPIKSISGKLLKMVLPLIAISIIGIILFMTVRARSIVVNMAEDLLKYQTLSNSNKYSAEVMSFICKADTFSLTLENREFTDDDDLFQFLEYSKSFSTNAPNGIYLGLDNGDFFDLSGWKPGDDYVLADRKWYQDGVKNSSFTVGAPYMDQVTNNLVVPIARAIKLKDGRTGVAASDMLLSNIMEEISAMKPLGKGSSMLLEDNVIISYPVDGFNGTAVTDHPDDEFVNNVYKEMTSNPTSVVKMSANGKRFFVDYEKIDGTPWTLISTIEENDIVNEINEFMIISWIVAAVMLVVIAFIVQRLIKSIVSNPVKQLTENIMSVTNNDFSIDIPSRGNDEIGVMNHNMRKFVNHMRETLANMRDVTQQLSSEAGNSREASDTMLSEATAQAESMNQIRETMDGMSQAVSELATDATDLAGKVNDLTSQGSETNDVMKKLVEKAGEGQKDMKLVTESMDEISKSMSEVNDAVESVDESAKKITDIIEMINSIASQTNLLSLNASIEAARAGEAGKGFAVVADEIGKLANDSANATTEIASIIGDIANQISSLAKKSTQNVEAIRKSAESVGVAEKTFEEIFQSLDITGDTMHEMIRTMGDVNEIATNVAAIAQEQSASSQEVTGTLDTLASSADEVAHKSQKVKESADGVAQGADSINGSVSMFRIG